MTKETKDSIEAWKAIVELLLKLKQLSPSRERALAATKLQEAGFWMDSDIRIRTDAASPSQGGGQ